MFSTRQTPAEGSKTAARRAGRLVENGSSFPSEAQAMLLSRDSILTTAKPTPGMNLGSLF